MLAPTTITLRRPSDDSDMILSRLESAGLGDNASKLTGSESQKNQRRPSDALLPSPYSSRRSLASPEGSSRYSSGTSLQGSDDCSSCGTLSPIHTPERRSSWACRGADGMKKELEKISNRLKIARMSLRGSADCLMSKLPRRRKEQDVNWKEAGGRRFNVDLDNGQVELGY